jgi:hypothetical protein
VHNIAETKSGLNPANHTGDNQSAYVGDESIVRDNYANPRIGTYENGYVRYDMAPEFDQEFAQYRWPYQGGPEFEWEIPLDQIERFNGLTANRTWIPWSAP